MNIIICEPNVPPYKKTISGKYEDLQNIIGENIKVLALNNPSIVIMCNQDIYENKRVDDHCRLNIPGTFVFLGRDNDRLRSLSKEEVNEIIYTIRKEDLTLV